MPQEAGRVELLPLEKYAERVGPQAASPEENEPGFFEMAARLSDLVEEGASQAAVLNAVSTEMLASLYFQTGLLRSDLIRGLSLLSSKDDLDYVLNQIRTRLFGLADEITVESSQKVQAWAVIADVHCPRIRGCVASYAQETASEQDLYIGVKVAGFGGGSGKSKKIGLGYKVPAREECRFVLVPARVQVEECSGRFGRFVRRTILNLGKGYATTRIPPTLDRCRTPLETCRALAWEVHPFKADPQEPPPAPSWKAEVGNVWRYSVGVEGLVPSLGWEVEVKVLKPFQYEYSLVGPNLQYHGVVAPETLGYAWAL